MNTPPQVHVMFDRYDPLVFGVWDHPPTNHERLEVWLIVADPAYLKKILPTTPQQIRVMLQETTVEPHYVRTKQPS